MKQRKIRGYYDEEGEPLYLGDEVYYLYQHPSDGIDQLFRGKIIKRGREYIVHVKIDEEHESIFYLSYCKGMSCSLIAHQYERNEPSLEQQIEYQRRIVKRITNFLGTGISTTCYTNRIKKHLREEEIVLKDKTKKMWWVNGDPEEATKVLLFQKPNWSFAKIK